MRELGDVQGMILSARQRLGRSSALAIVIGSAIAVTGCTSSGPGGRLSAGKEYFAESEYGVKASPRVTNLRTRLPRGGGRDMVGKPYKVKGKWYRPHEDRDYKKVGAASWYGDAFHGRLTANGEIYDMTHLTAAHPTMPLPSYARVTNLKNGSSVIVRVNDRGPYADGRIIDLSKRAAQMLDYTHAGVARVQVEYLGRAPLNGRDDQFLLASYRPGKGTRQPIDDGLPAGVMVAMNGPTPSAPARNLAFPTAPGGLEPMPPVALATASSARGAIGAAQSFSLIAAGDPVLPDFGPEIPERPGEGIGVLQPVRVASLGKLSYADERIAGAARAFAAIDPAMTAADVVASWKRLNAGAPGSCEDAGTGEYVAAGTFADRAAAEALAARLSRFGSASVEADADSFSVVLTADGRNGTDELAELAWENGAPDAFVVRD